MTVRVITDVGRVWAYVSEKIPTPIVAGMKALGLERDGVLVVGVLYEGYNGVNVWVHIRAEPDKWLNREFLRYGFEYPFYELGCSRISGYVEASNDASRRLCERLGFEQEAVLKGAASDGGDVILYVMWKHKCRFLKENEHGP